MASKKFITLPSGQKMPNVGLGTWQATDENQLKQAIEAAIKAGYRHIDTAHIYQNEAMIGKVLKDCFASGKIKREDLFITTKLPIQGIHPDRVELFLKESLANLQLDYVDLYLIHMPMGTKYEKGQTWIPQKEDGSFDMEGSTDHVGVWKAMEKQVDAGRVKNIGLSNYNIKQIELILKSARIKPANLQVELHANLQQRQLVDFCKKNKISIVAYCPLGNPSYNDILAKFGAKPREVEVNLLNEPVVKQIAAKHSKSPAQVVLRFLLQQDICVIPKSVTPQRIEENLNLYDFSLTDAEMAELKKLDKGEPGRLNDFRAFKGIPEHPDYPF